MTAPLSKPLPDKVFPFLFRFLEPKTAFFLGVLFVSSILEAFTLVGLSSLVRAFVDKAETLGTGASIENFYPLFGVAAGVWLLYAVVVALNFLGWRWGKLPYELDLREKLFRMTQRQSQRYFEDRLSGDISYRIMDVPYNAIWVLAHMNFAIIPSLGVLVFAVFWLFQVSAAIAAGAVLWLVLFLTVTFFFVRGCLAANRERSKVKGKVSGGIVDSIANNNVVRLFAGFQGEDRRIGDRIDQERFYTLRYYNLDMAMGMVHKVLLALLFILTLACAVRAFLEGGMTLGDLSMTGSLLLMIILRSAGLGTPFIAMTECIGAIRSGIDVLNEAMEVTDKPGAQGLAVPRGEIVFDQVSFRYNDIQNMPVLRDFSVTIPPRQKLGLVGLSGVGKTTVVSLLLRLYDRQTGAISIDGQDIAEVTQDSLRRNIAVIPQDTSLFHRSLMDNIRYGQPEATDEEVIGAAKKAYAHDFIAALPEGYETLVGERGVKLSGGQRQRIAIARAILKDAPILVLDEATSALDSESEKLIQESLKELMEGKTVIAIAHRLSTIAHLDRLIVMEEGRIVEDDGHKELLKRKGLYARLWEMQSGGFIGG